MKLTTTTQQKHSLSQQGILAQQLIEKTAVELNQYIRQEMEINPALEEELDDFSGSEMEDESDLDVPDYLQDDISGYKMQADGYTDTYKPEIRDFQSLQEQLIEQLNGLNLNDDHKYICGQIIGSLTESGMFGIIEEGNYTPENIPDFTKRLNETFPCSEKDVEYALSIIQSFEPAGVGARNTQECVLIQLDRLPQNRVTELAMQTVEFAWDDLLSRDNRHLAKILNIKTDRDLDNLQKSLAIIKKMSPKPVMTSEQSSFRSKSAMAKVADFHVSASDAGFIISVNDKAIPHIYISRSYASTVEKYYRKKNVEDEVKIHRDYVNRGKDLIQSIEYRNQKLQHFIQIVVNEQRDFFLTGDHSKIRPLTMTSISERTDLSINTISRMCKDKVIDTDFGMINLRDMFDQSLDKSINKDVAKTSVGNIVLNAVKQERKDKPLSDEQIAEIIKSELNLDHIEIKTVSNLRRGMDIPSVGQRTDLRHQINESIKELQHSSKAATTERPNNSI